VPAAPGTPTASQTTITKISSTAAAFTGTVGSSGLPTQYHFQYTPVKQPGSVPKVTPTVSTPAGSLSVRATASVKGLVPNTKYAVNLVATNTLGTTTGQTSTFSTLIEPGLPVSLAPGKNGITIGQSVKLSARVKGKDSFEAAGLMQTAFAPFRHYTDADTAYVSRSGRLRYTERPDRNTRFRVEMTGLQGPFGGPVNQIRKRTFSFPVTVFVDPAVQLSVARSSHDKRFVNVTFSAKVHPLGTHFNGELVYFYSGSQPGGPFTRFAAVQLRRGGKVAHSPDMFVSATASLLNTSKVYFDACVRSRILPDMGEPFTDKSCGGPTFH
jgi:hypothetical protein